MQPPHCGDCLVPVNRRTAMAAYQLASKAQQGFYKSLTGEWLPRGTSKSRASQMIAKAKAAGPAAPKPREISVSGCIVQDPCRVDNGRHTFEVYIDYRFVRGGFETEAE